MIKKFEKFNVDDLIEYFRELDIYSASSTSAVINVHRVAPVNEQLARIERTSSLKPNWDGMGAVAPSSATVRMVKRTVHELGYYGFIPHHIGAGPNGELFVEYRSSGSRQAQVYFNAEDGHELLLIEGDEYPYDGRYDLRKLLNHLHGR